MMQLEGYAVDALLYESRQSRILRGRRLADGTPVIFKVLEQFHSPQKRARFQQEYHLTRKLKLDGVVSAYDMETVRGTPVMVIEDFGGTSLNRLDVNGRLPLREWLSLAICIAGCLDQLHRQRIMHKDVNPSNIVWNRRSNVVKLIDLGISTELSREVPEVRNPERMEGTLLYLSPEQTGRMNRAMDYRTDFYSLGVTFHELLTGSPPFGSDDPLELVHAHIARMPVPVDQDHPGIPRMVAAIVSKLLGKTAEERYQSAAGLQADLQTCAATLDDDGDIPLFALGRTDFSGRLQISQKLYGRDQQIATLLNVYARASQGAGELLLVAGYSGVGKSALVHEIQKPITRNRGCFIEGKFDQFKRDIPYASLSQAFRELIQQLLTKGETVVAQWKDTLLQVLGKNAQVIIDVIPTLELIVGPQPAAISLPPAQEQNRFNHEFRNFVGTFASAEHPLVIFLDDLQWADLPTLQLMSLLLRAPAVPHLLLIGAYRHNEVSPAHALAMTIREMQKAGASVQTISLPPLQVDEVSELLCDTLHASPERVRDLAQLCLAKTQGNPFFLNQFLGALVERHVLIPDPIHGGWQWTISSVQQAGITDNIVELMVAKLHTLPLPTQRVLQGAACLGNEFDLTMLAVICDLPENRTAALLWDALHEELIVPLDDHYKYVGLAGVPDASLVPSYRFLHDRVQQAAYMLSDDVEKAATHLAIGRVWLKSWTEANQQSLLFDLVNHLNLGSVLMTDAAERHLLARLNLSAARRAKASAAYRPALVYLESALALVADADWEGDYNLLFTLHLETAEAAYLSHDLARMEQVIGIALQHAGSLHDQARAHEISIQAFIFRDKLDDALDRGLLVLRLLGVSFPKNAGSLHVVADILYTRWTLRGKSINELETLPDATNPLILTARKILSNIISAAYYARPHYFPLFVLKAVRLSLAYGHAPSSASNSASYGGILGGIVGNISRGAEMCEMATRLQQRPAMGLFRSRTAFVILAGIEPYQVPLHKTLARLAEGYVTGMEIGDVEFAANSAMVYCFHAFYCGNDLAELESEVAAYLPELLLPAALDALRMLQQAFRNLLGQTPDPRDLRLATPAHEQPRDPASVGDENS